MSPMKLETTYAPDPEQIQDLSLGLSLFTNGVLLSSTYTLALPLSSLILSL